VVEEITVIEVDETCDAGTMGRWDQMIPWCTYTCTKRGQSRWIDYV